MQTGHEKLGLDSRKNMPDVLAYFFVPQDPNDRLTRARAWQNTDISDNSLYNGDVNTALGTISAKAIAMPTSTDQYFWAGDNRDEVPAIRNAEFREIPTRWGHAGGRGMDPADREFVDKTIKELIDQSSV